MFGAAAVAFRASTYKTKDYTHTRASPLAGLGRDNKYEMTRTRTPGLLGPYGLLDCPFAAPHGA